MLRRKANVYETYRIILPGCEVLSVFPPGTLLRVTGYPLVTPEGNPYALVDVQEIPSTPVEYNVVVPKGSKVHIHEE